METISSLDWLFPCKSPQDLVTPGDEQNLGVWWGRDRLVVFFFPQTHDPPALGDTPPRLPAPRGRSSGTNEKAKRPHHCKVGVGGDPTAAGAGETRRKPARRGRAGPIHSPPAQTVRDAGKGQCPSTAAHGPPQQAASLTLAPEPPFPALGLHSNAPPAPTARHRGGLARAGFRYGRSFHRLRPAHSTRPRPLPAPRALCGPAHPRT